jgi:hypothetical protein
MSNLVVCVSFTQSQGQPATGLTLTDIDITLTSVNKSTGATAAIWNTENPTAEVDNVGSYIKVYASADLDTYAYVATAAYSGATALDCDYVGGAASAQLDEITALNDPSAEEIRTEIDSNSTQLAAIVADTNELQTDDVPGLIAALNDPTAAEIRTEIDANSTQLAAIVADTNELQGDLTDGGRLDLLIDAVKAVTDNLPDSGALTTLLSNVAAILADTGTDGVAVATAVAQAIADEILKRSVENVEDTADADSLAELIMAGLNAAISGTTLTIRKPSDDSTFNTRTVTVDADVDPVVGIT